MSPVQVAAFNDLLGNVLDFLRKSFPTDEHLVKAHKHLMMGLSLSPREIPLQFVKAVLPYESQLHSHNAQFFETLLGEAGYDSAFQLGPKWHTLPPAAQSYMWDSVTQLLKLAKLIFQL